MRKRVLSGILVLAMTVGVLSGCGQGDGKKGEDGLANTDIVDNAIKNAEQVEDLSGYVYSGKAPITKDGGTLKILAQTSNYSNVDIANAPIVKAVFEEAGVEPDWQLIDYDSYEKKATPIISSGDTDADIIKIPDNDPNQVTSNRVFLFRSMSSLIICQTSQNGYRKIRLRRPSLLQRMDTFIMFRE